MDPLPVPKPLTTSQSVAERSADPGREPPGCPLCGRAAPALTREYDARRLVADWREALGVDAAGDMPPGLVVSLWSCRSCGLAFYHPAKAGSGAFYAQLQARLPYYPGDKWELRAAVDDVRALGLGLGRGARVLEVGCGDGSLLKRLESVGVCARGIEINPDAVAAARARGLDVRCASPEQLLPECSGGFDAVLAFQVLEHVPKPRVFLEQCAALLSSAPGSRLILGVPNADGWFKHLNDPLDLPPHHMTRWGRRAMVGAAELLGLRVERLEVEPLTDAYAGHWAAGVVGRLTGRLIDITKPPGLAARVLSKAARTLRLGRVLPGHTLYACLTR